MDNPIRLQVEGGIVWVTVHGPITRKLGDRILVETLACARQHHTWRFLFDLRRAGLVEGIVSLHQRVIAFEAAGMPAHAPRAVLCSHRTPDYDFLETSSINRGHNLQVFTDGEEALNWLASQTETSPGQRTAS